MRIKSWRQTVGVATLGLTVGTILCGVASGAPPAALSPFLEKHCVECHDADTKKGGLDLEALSADLADATAMATWIRLHDRVVAGEMPPAKKPQPAPQDRAAFAGLLAQSLTKWDSELKGTVIRRLNRTEYENTLRDLLGVESELQERLPEDGKAFGFDNVGEALDLSAVHLQRYMEAARVALGDALHKGPAPETQKFTGSFLRGLNDGGDAGMDRIKREDGTIEFFGPGLFPLALITPDFVTQAEGKYRIMITGRAVQSAEPVTFTVVAGGGGKQAELHPIGIFEMPPAKTTVTFEAYLRPGEQLRLMPRVTTTKQDFRKTPVREYKGPGIALQPMELEGPLVGAWPGKGHTLLFGDLASAKPAKGKGDAPSPKGKKKKFVTGSERLEIVSDIPAADAQRLLSAFVPAAFRRPVTEEKIAPYLKLAQDELAADSSFEDAMLTAYAAVLCSPDFLYLKEPVGKLDDFALVSRLSYMLWVTAPDAELLALAAKGALSEPAMLRTQTERLLNDPRAARFTQSFTGQWLNLREIDFTTPDKQLYPEFDDTLKAAMMQETELFFNEVLRGNLNVANFLDSNWTMLNERLAQHYGVPGVKGLEFRKVALKLEYHRGGVLTHASVLKVTANGTTTSPVVRGAWVLDRIFGTPSPPPPPGTPGVEPDIRGATTLRQQLEKHRTLESCNGCHRNIDPPGFALENYDVMGGWREKYRALGDVPVARKLNQQDPHAILWRPGPPVDPTGATPDGRRFSNLTDYKKILLAHPERFTRALTEKLAIYSSGRGMGFSDRAELDRITRDVFAKGNGFRDLVHAVVQSEMFRNK